MATKKKPAKDKREKRSYGAKLKWVADNLSKDELKHADEFSPTAEEILDFLMGCVDRGIDVKVAWDDYSNAYQATAIGAWNGFPSAGIAVSGRSNSSCGDALLMLWYKVVIKAEYDLSEIASDDEAADMRG